MSFLFPSSRWTHLSEQLKEAEPVKNATLPDVPTTTPVPDNVEASEELPRERIAVPT